MDINQNQQLNTFLKGMNTDTSDALLSTDLYRFAKNVRIVTDTDNNSGELRIVDGNVPFPIINDLSGTILAMDSIRNIIVVIISEGETEWSVYRYWFGKDDCLTLVYKCTDKALCGTEGKQLSTVLRWESEENIKLYIANGEDPLISLRIDREYKNGNDQYPSYAEMFLYNNVNLPAPTLTTKNGGAIPAAVVLYAYRLYKENGGATTVSAISRPISLYRDSSHGFAPNKNTNKAVEIDLGNISSSELDRIQVYRILYQQNGQLPTITMIADQKWLSNVITDYGTTSIEQVAVSEFISLFNIKITPSVIESKGDYLFLGGNAYALDDADKTFKEIDVRCYSLGNYTMQGSSEVSVLQINNGDVSVQETVDDSELKSHAYEDGLIESSWNTSDWGEIGNTGYNGYGKYFAWKYKFSSGHAISPTDQRGGRTYRRGEVYRFGVRLFDHKGNASSVKWMCDITMPPLFEQDYEGLSLSPTNPFPVPENTGPNNSPYYWELEPNDDQLIDGGGGGTSDSSSNSETENQIWVREIGIEFTPINTNDDKWQNVAAYEIVLCERRFTDSYVVMLGIGSKVDTVFGDGDVNNMFSDEAQSDVITPTGFFTMNNIVLVDSWVDSLDGSDSPGDRSWTSRHAIPSNHIIMFASPEYVYQKDDVKDLIDLYKSNLSIKTVLAYKPLSTVSPNNFNGVLARHDDDGNTLKHGNDGLVSLGVRTKNDSNNYPSYYLGFNDSNNLFKGYYHDKIVLIYNAPFGVQSRVVSNKYRYSGTMIQTDENPVRSDVFSTTDNNGVRCFHYFNYFRPESISDNITTNTSNVTYTVKNVAYADSPMYSDYAKDENVIVRNNVTAIDLKTFINWTSPFWISSLMYANFEEIGNTKNVMLNTGGDVPYINDNDDGTVSKSSFLYPLGSGARCILISTEENINDDIYTYDLSHAPYIHVQNIIKPATPYGGYSNAAILNSSYLSVGGYASSNASVSVFGGDSFIKIFTFNAAHEWYDSGFTKAVKMATVYAVPLETSIDLRAQFSTDLYGVDSNSRYVLDKVSSFNGYSQSTDAYSYNTAYNAPTNVRTWYPNLTTEGLTNDFDTRVHFSERKINNEKIDNWLLYKAMNFLDVDSRYGKITDMKLFKDRLLFWQEHAVGLLSVNERIIINDMNDALLQLGTGGVLERFDYLSTTYGMKKHQFAKAAGDNALYWWDGNNKEILQYSLNIVPLSTAKHIKNYINSAEGESELPTIVYDNKYKEAVCNVVDNESVVYSEQVDAFTSVYDANVLFWCDILGTVYEISRDDMNIYKHNTDDGEALFFGVDVTPYVKYVVNKEPQFVKTFDILTFGGRFYEGNGFVHVNEGTDAEPIYVDYGLEFDYKTPLKQHSSTDYKKVVTDREYDFRLNIPRDGNTSEYGDRMRGKTMRCEFKSSSNSKDFSLQYIITKFRMSWS